MKWRRKDGSIRPHSGQHHAHSVKSGQPIYHDEDDQDCQHVKFHGQGRMGPESRRLPFGIMVQGRDRDHHGGIDHRHGRST